MLHTREQHVVHDQLLGSQMPAKLARVGVATQVLDTRLGRPSTRHSQVTQPRPKLVEKEWGQPVKPSLKSN